MTLNFRPFEELETDSFASPFDRQRQQSQPQAGEGEDQEQGSPNVIVDILRGVGNGIGNAADATIELTGFEVGLDDVFGETQTTVGSIAQGISQFATGFIPVVGVLGKVGRLGTIGRGVVAGAITDFTVFDGQEERLSNLVQENPVLANPVTEFLAADEDDTQALGRLKNVMEGAALGAVFDTFALGLKQLKSARKARAEGLEPEAVVERVRQEAQPEDVAPEIPDPEVPTPEFEALPEGVLPQLADEDTLRNFIQQVDDVRQGALAGEFDLTAHPRSSKLTGEEATAVGLDPNKYSIIEAFGDHDAEAVAFTIREKLTPLVREEVERRRSEILADGGVAEDLIEEEIEAYRRARGDSTREKTLASLEQFAGDIQGVRADQEALEVRIRTQRVMLAAAQRDFAAFHKRVFEAVQSGAETPAMLAEYARAKRALEVATFELSGTKSSMGRNLRQLRDVPAYVGGPNGGAALEAYNRVVNGAGGETALKREIIALGEDMAEHGTEILGERILQRKAVFNAGLEYWMNSILSGLKTLNINAISGAMVSLYRPMEGILGAGARGLFSGDFSPVAEYVRMYGDLLDSTRDAWKYSKQSFGSFLEDGENILLPDSRTFQDGEARQAISAEAFGKAADSPVGKFLNTAGPIVRLPSRSLQTTDEFWKQVNARAIIRRKLRKEGMNKGLQGDQLAAHIEDGLEAVIQDGELFTVQRLQKQAFAQAKAELPQGTPAQIREKTRELYNDLWENEGKFAQPLADAAREYAEDVTFTKALRPGSLSKGLQDLVVSHPMLRFVLPFVRTPVNILSFAAERGANPLATARAWGDLLVDKTVARDYPQLREAQGKLAREVTSSDPEVASEAVGRLVMATGTTLTVMAFAAEGRITGRGPADREQRRLLEASGWQPYSIRVGDTYVSYSRLDPFSTVIGVFADLQEYGRWTDISTRTRLRSPCSAPSPPWPRTSPTSPTSRVFAPSWMSCRTPPRT